MSGGSGAAAGGQGAGPDPSMEDILASIRRILTEDEAPPPAAAAPAPPPSPPPPDPSVLTLDASMLVREQAQASPAPPPRAEAPQPLQPEAPHAAGPHDAQEGLVASDTAAAATASMGKLLKTVATSVDRHTLVHRGGPTIEDIVREELRPLLKGWLDDNLPDLVERLVRAEIERLVNRAMS